jgi:hypothetical protein
MNILRLTALVWKNLAFRLRLNQLKLLAELHFQTRRPSHPPLPKQRQAA